MRVLFQILRGAATAISVAITVRTSHQFHCGPMATRHVGLVAEASVTRPSSSPIQAIRGSISQDISVSRTILTTARGMLRKVNGPKFQISSLLGMAWRISPPINHGADGGGM